MVRAVIYFLYSLFRFLNAALSFFKRCVSIGKRNWIKM